MGNFNAFNRLFLDARRDLACGLIGFRALAWSLPCSNFMQLHPFPTAHLSKPIRPHTSKYSDAALCTDFTGSPLECYAFSLNASKTFLFPESSRRHIVLDPTLRFEFPIEVTPIPYLPAGPWSNRKSNSGLFGGRAVGSVMNSPGKPAGVLRWCIVLVPGSKSGRLWLVTEGSHIQSCGSVPISNHQGHCSKRVKQFA